MDDTKKPSKFGIGLLIGSIVGAVTAFFFSPTSGPENREEVAKKIQELKKLLEEKEIDKKVKEIFGEVTEDARAFYFKAKHWLVEELANLSGAIKHIDEEKYKQAVEEVIVKAKKEWKKDVKQIDKLKTHLLKEWEKLRQVD